LSDTKKKQRVVFLFNDLFVIAKEAGMMAGGADKLKVVDMIPLDAALVHDAEPDTLNFQLTHAGIANYIFVAENAEAKSESFVCLFVVECRANPKQPPFCREMD